MAEIKHETFHISLVSQVLTIDTYMVLDQYVFHKEIRIYHKSQWLH